MDAADIQDDGLLDLSDAIVLISYEVLGGPSPCSPFPEAGMDPNEDNLTCNSTGGGGAVEDPAARLEILDATATSDGKFTTTVLVSSSRTLAGFEGTIAVEGGILADGQSIEPTNLTAFEKTNFNAASVHGQKLHFGFLASIHKPVSLPPGDGVAVVELTSICLAAGTPAGSYALTIETGELVDYETAQAIHPVLTGATLTVSADLAQGAGCDSLADAPATPACGGSQPPDPPDPCDPCDPPPDDVPGVDFRRGDANSDGRLSISDGLMIRRYLFNGDRAPPCLDSADTNDDASLDISDYIHVLVYLFLGGGQPPSPSGVVGPDPTADQLGCVEYAVEPPEETDDLVAIGAVQGAAGQTVEIPVYLTSDAEVEAYQLVLRYDPAVLSFPLAGGGGETIEEMGLSLAGTYYGEMYGTKSFNGYFSLTPNQEEGILFVAFIPHIVKEEYATPPGSERLVFKFLGTISPDAEPGTETVLEPTNGPDGGGVGPELLVNELTHRGDARFVSVVPQTAPGVLRIIPDILIFRGDSSQDGVVNLSDAVYTLNWLFLGGPEPLCPDEADANDDGNVDISDPIATLQTLFLGSSSIAPPYPLKDFDPTVDSLGPCIHVTP
jgi:hypothetical protein